MRLRPPPSGSPAAGARSPGRLGGLLAVFALATGFYGCPGALEDPDRFDYLFEDSGYVLGPDGGVIIPLADAGIVSGADGGCDPPTTIFPTTCATAACHSSALQQAHLDLQSPGLPTRLIGKAAYTCAGDLINASNPDSSVLYLQVTAAPPDTFRMPLGGTLTDEQIACMKQWVENAVSTPDAGTADGGAVDGGLPDAG